MEVTALGFRLTMNVLLPLAAHLHFSYSQTAAFPQVVPNRQQHFEHEAIVVSCEGLEGLTGWRVLRKTKGVVRPCVSTLETSSGPCEIKTLYRSDSGEYWCEMGGVKRSNTVNITVTAGSLILESPVLPVMKGDNVTLRCTKKHSDDDNNELTAEFYKDGVLLGGSSTGNLILHSVSRSDEGLYKCSSSGAGDSAESWLIVTAHEDPQPVSLLSQLYLLVRIGISVFLLSLLLFLGVLQCQKHETATRGAPTSPSSQSCSFPQTVSAAASMAEESQTTNAAITKPRKEKEPGVSSCSATAL